MSNLFSISPPLKWVGGKRQLLPSIIPFLPFSHGQTIEHYYEPFLGGGSILIYLLMNYSISNAIASDLNPHLINVFNSIKYHHKEVLNTLNSLWMRHSLLNSKEEKQQHYYEIRDYFNNQKLQKYNPREKDNAELASVFIFLNKTGFNGLYRENSKGLLNTPVGSGILKTDSSEHIYSEYIITTLSTIFSRVTFLHCDYCEIKKYFRQDGFLYCDPPYRPIKNKSFTKYLASDFNDDCQIALANFLKEASKNRIKFLLSNSDPKNYDLEDNFFDELYHDFSIDRVTTKRLINAKAIDRKNQVTEILVRNY